MIGTFSVHSFAEEIQIGSGSETNAWLPSHSYYKYSLTQQIYKADEIGGAGSISSIAFYNGGLEKTRTYDIYLVNTEKESFSGSSDWISVTSSDLVFSGSVTMAANVWTTIQFSPSFEYEGNNLAVVVNDKTGSYSNGMECLVFTPSGNQGVLTLYASKDGSANYDLTNPGNASGTVTFKNQIILDIETAAVTCAKPKNFTATGITSNAATLTWTAGAEGQSNWEVYLTTTATDIPDENTTPTYQVTECSKVLTGLDVQTTYYAFVRSVCGGDDGNSKWANTSFTTTREAITIDAENPYSQDFENNNDWTFANGTFTNQWWWGSATNNGGEKAIYISDDNGEHNNYSHSSLVVYASQLFNFAHGVYTFSFDWNAKGESSYDFLRVALVPGDKTFTAGGSLPSGVTASGLPNTWIALDGGSKLNLSDDWQTKVTETDLSGTYTMVFLWRNDNSGGNQPPAAIDNISISFMTCPRPTGLAASNIAGRTATLSWTENGTANNWVLQYGTASDFSDATSISVSGTPSTDLTGLSPETKYYARVKSILDNDESSWSDVVDFTTTVTCPRPTNLNASNITTTSVQLSWNAGGSECGWDISICETTSMHPETDGVLYHVSENPYTVEGLTPDKLYYSYVRANCAEEGLSAWSITKGFTTLPTCIKPTNFMTSNVTSSSAKLTWTAGEDGQDAWNITYKKDSDTEWTTIPVTTTTYTLTNLSPVSTYYAKVQANCGDGDLSKWTETTFTTGCGAIDLPYTCDFEGPSQTVNNCLIPSCWSVIRGYYNSTYRYGVPTMATQSTSTQPIVQQTHSGSYSLYFLNSTNYGTTEEYAILPEISDKYNMSNVQIRFWVRSYSSACSMEVGIMTDPSDANTYVQVEVVDMTSTYVEKTVSLSNYSGNGRYIALKCPAPTMYSQAFYVDDITVEINPDYLFTKDITAYTEGSKDHYYLIASPVGEVNPENVTNMLGNNYDLYAFDQNPSDGLEWINYKNGNYNLTPGTGYLYANSENVTLSFIGTPYNSNGEVHLSKVSGSQFEGWNLVGNPFAEPAYISNRAFYRMNDDGTEIVAATTGTAIASMEGIFVIANENNETLTFSTDAIGSKNNAIVMNLNRAIRGSASTIDRAIVRFDEGDQLPKFQLNPSNTKLYITQGNVNFAVVHGEDNGELPVNFKAEHNGTYTLNVETDGIEMTYLHLIDNITGADVDLLECSSYTFDAKTSDYTSRFKLVFDCWDTNDNNETFAYINNGNIIVNNMGNAIVQVIDIMGRIISSESINGSASINFNETSGIYLLRLITGNDVKVQKVVVR